MVAAMKIRAAVLEEFAQPLVVQEVDLDGPGPGEVLVRLAACGVCHTDMYTASGADPSGYAPTVLGHEGAGVVEALGENVDRRWPSATTSSRCSRPSAASACTAAATDEPLPGDPRAAEPRLPARRHDAPAPRRGAHPPLHGHQTFAEATVMPEIALAKIDPEAPLDVVCSLACGATTGHRRGAVRRQGRGGLDVRRLRRGPGRPRRGRRRAARGRRAHHLRRPRRGPAGGRAPHGATDTFLGGPDAVQQILDMTDGFGADYTFEATGNVKVMRQAVESARMGWGLCTVAGVAGKGEVLEVVPRFLITGRRIAGASFGGAKGRDRVPELVDLYMKGELDLAAFVTRRIALEEVNDAFAAMDRHEGVRTVITSF